MYSAPSIGFSRYGAISRKPSCRYIATAVRIIGTDALTERYELALTDAGVLAERGHADAAARGLWRIAARAGIIAAPVDA